MFQKDIHETETTNLVYQFEYFHILFTLEILFQR